MRPTPTLKGKSAKRFYEKINQGEISTKQKKFLDECLQLLDEYNRCPSGINWNKKIGGI